jgi:hypothetical protein
MELDKDTRYLFSSERFVLRKPEAITNPVFNNATHRKQFMSLHCNNFLLYRLYHPRRLFVLVWSVYLVQKAISNLDILIDKQYCNGTA